MNKKAIIGGFVVDFWAIVAIFIIISIYLIASWGIKLTDSNYLGTMYLEEPTSQLKILESNANGERNLELFINYHNDFYRVDKSSLEIIKKFSDNAGILRGNTVDLSEFKGFFSNLDQINYIEFSKNQTYLFCIKGVCELNNPQSNVKKNKNLDGDYIEINLLGVNVTLSNINLKK